MGRRLLLGNWKLHHTVAEATAYAAALREAWPHGRAPAALEVGLAPPATCLHPLAQALAGSDVAVAAQHVDVYVEGAYTGASSATLLREAGASYALVGHSERRQLFAEADADAAGRLQACWRAGLTPVLCVGETQAERAGGQTAAVLRRQVLAALRGGQATGPAAQGTTEAAGTSQALQALQTLQAPLVVAYEPVWAIGTGHSATPEDVAQVHAQLRTLLHAELGPRAGEATRLLYGGSVTADNVAALVALPDVNGALVGGASLAPASFAALVAHAAP